jgi:hypothetical protein
VIEKPKQLGKKKKLKVVTQADVGHTAVAKALKNKTPWKEVSNLTASVFPNF